MPQYIINNTDSSPDTLKQGMDKANDNFTQLFSRAAPPLELSVQNLTGWTGSNLVMVGDTHAGGNVGAGTVFNGTTAYALPVYLYAGAIIDKVAQQKNQTTPTITARAAFYSVTTTTGYPSSLLRDLGQISFGGSHNGIEYWDTTSNPVTIATSGVYWLVIMYSTTTPQISRYIFYTSPLGYMDPGTGNPTPLGTRYMGLIHNMAYGAFPSTFPTAAPSYITTSGNLPITFLAFRQR